MWRLLYLICGSLYAVASGAAASLAAPYSAFFPIDITVRGLELYNTFNSPLFPIVTGSPTLPSIWFQTSLSNRTPYQTYSHITSGGMIPYVQTFAPAPNYTAFVLSYFPVASGNIIQYLVVFTEQIQALIYYPQRFQFPNQNGSFAAVPVNTTPYFSIDPVKRAEDIVYATNQLKALITSYPNSEVWIQTSLSGPFRPPGVYSNGLLENVTYLEYSSSLIHIQFNPRNYSSDTLQIAVPPELVQMIVFVRDASYP